MLCVSVEFFVEQISFFEIFIVSKSFFFVSILEHFYFPIFPCKNLFTGFFMPPKVNLLGYNSANVAF